MGKWKITGEAKQRINEQIRVSSVRVIAADGTQLGVMPTDKAMEQARRPISTWWRWRRTNVPRFAASWISASSSISRRNGSTRATATR